MITLDHLAVAGETLAAATRYVEETLGVPVQDGGAHAVFHTHNSLLGLADGLYLEAIAINPDAPTPERARWFDLDRFAGQARLTNWICRCDDLDRTLADLPYGFRAPVDLHRGDLRWRMAVPRNGILPFDNCAPALIEWQSGGHPAEGLAQAGCTLERLEVSHPRAAELRAILAPLLADARVVIAQGAARLRAHIATPQGSATL
ncbi:VOC family protein [uncultured Sulfitobacter sp.]|uniref:VOC family protein n=1 Tax=uncultured Sulfitobacter sp. TaxID=191468 RepID=UPI0026131599|nr:VOC family protein [uncultured Sulfitobacter sp.]